MSRAVDLSLALPMGDLQAYQRAVNDLPMLSAEEECELATRYRHDEDLDAAWRLVTSHLRFVVKIARGYRGYGLPLADLIQEGNVGLMKAVKRFDPAVGARLVTFAVHYIRAEIHEFILRNWRIVKLATTKAKRKLFFKLRSAKKRADWLSRAEAEEVAGMLDVSTDDVLEMEQRLCARDAAFDPTAGGDGEAYRPAPVAYLEDLRFEPATTVEACEWETYCSERLRSALAALDARSREIIHKRWLNEGKATLHELAERYGVSAERIRQLEGSALKKLKAALDC